MRNVIKQSHQGKDILNDKEQLDLQTKEYLQLVEMGKMDIYTAIDIAFYFGVAVGNRANKGE